MVNRLEVQQAKIETDFAKCNAELQTELNAIEVTSS